jgi:hypothetical protein
MRMYVLLMCSVLMTSCAPKEAPSIQPTVRTEPIIKQFRVINEPEHMPGTTTLRWVRVEDDQGAQVGVFLEQGISVIPGERIFLSLTTIEQASRTTLVYFVR